MRGKGLSDPSPERTGSSSGEGRNAGKGKRMSRKAGLMGPQSRQVREVGGKTALSPVHLRHQ